MQNIYLAISFYFSHLVATYLLRNGIYLPGKSRWMRGIWAFLVVSILTYVFTGDWLFFWPALATGLAALLQILMVNQKKSNDPIYQLISELLWLGFAIIFSVLFSTHNLFWLNLTGSTYYGVLVLCSGWILLAFPVGTLIGLLLRKYQGRSALGFPSAGRMIGVLERSILFILFLVNAPVGVGFLITAKTLFRFGEIYKGDDQKAVEYILIGTLLSFLLGMLITILTMLAADSFFTQWNFKLLGI